MARGPCACACCAQCLFLAGGWLFCTKILFKDIEVHHVSIQLLFSLTFALSCAMFELIIFEIGGVMDQPYVEACTPRLRVGTRRTQPRVCWRARRCGGAVRRKGSACTAVAYRARPACLPGA